MISRESLERLAALASEAGAAALRHYEHLGEVTQKGDRGPVTAADRAAHTVIVRGLEQWTPDIPIISEEGTLPEFEQRRGWKRFWLVDPLDGTKEFIQRNGEFTVNIALIEDAAPVMGVVLAPAIALLYVAAKGLGAWKSERGGPWREIAYRPVPAGQPLVVAESRSHPSAALEDWLKSVPVARRVQAGSSLKFCWVADGQADVYPRLGPTMEWDTAAGDCIYRYAGSAPRPKSPLSYNKPDLTNGGFIIGIDAA
jgi:3'(2'), 5'-bisphosphate nucleotidase